MNSFNFLKNYIFIFILSLFLVFITKFIFLLYLFDNFNNYDLITTIKAIFLGYKFDFAVASIVTLLATLFDFHKTSLALLASFLISILFLIQISDIMYFYESSRHIGYEVSDAITDASGLIMTAFSQHTILTISSIIASIFIFYFLVFFLYKNTFKIAFNKYYFIKKILIIVITVFFARGMFQSIPLNPWQAVQIGDVKLSSLSLNGTYNALYSFFNKSKKLKPIQTPDVSSNVIHTSFKELYNNRNTYNLELLDKPNIVFLFLESWSAVNIKNYGFEKNTTPFFTELLQKSIRPKAMIANGHRTTEGIFATISSFQNPLGRTIAKTQLQDYDYPSIINLLVKKDNYESAFFQGSSKETSGTGSFAQKLGFKNSYGKKDIQNRIYEENYWGVHDPDLYNFAIDKINKMQKPFVIGINGATTHDDKIPKKIKHLNFSENETLNNQLNALHFSDSALKEFITKVEKIYPNTLFVIFADHCGGVKGSSFENYLIPFALYHQKLKPKYIDHFVSQRDITPSILDLIYPQDEYKEESFSGKSILSNTTFFADYFHNGILGWVEGNFILEINITTQNKKCYQIINFKDKEIQCTPEILDFEKRALSFTKISQKLIFNGEVKQFKEYKNGKK